MKQLNFAAHIVWLHTLTPYGGGTKPDAQGKATEYNGFYSLPEVGERVLTEFLGEWDSEAVIAGTVRAHPVSIHHNPQHAKRWRTPAGNEISLVSRAGTEVVQMHTQDHLVFESQVSGGGQSVLLTCGDGGANIVLFKFFTCSNPSTAAMTWLPSSTVSGTYPKYWSQIRCREQAKAKKNTEVQKEDV